MESFEEVPLELPPTDPDDWTDEQWIEWLKKTDAPGDAHGRPVTPLGRVAHSSAGSVLGQAMLGMAAALYGRTDNEIVVVAEGSPQPDEDKAFDVHLDHDHPERSVVVFRRRSARSVEGTSQDLE